MQNGIQLKIEDYICENNKIYFISSAKSVLGQYDFQTKRVSILLDYSQIVGVHMAFARIIMCCHKIYCVPCYAEDIYCYNLKTKQFYNLNIEHKIFEKMPKRKIIEPVEVEGYVCCVCRSPHLVITINSETDQFDVDYFEKMEEEHDIFKPVVRDGVIRYPFLSNCLVSFDVKKRAYYMTKVYEKVGKSDWDYIFHFLYDDEGDIWICSFKGELYRVKDDNVEKIEIPREHIGKYKNIQDGSIQYMISEMISADEKIYLVLADDDRILQYGIRDKRFEWINGLRREGVSNEEMIHYDNCKFYGDIMFIYMRDSGMFYIWNLHKHIFKRFDFVLAGDAAAKLQLFLLGNETGCMDLNFYCSYIQAFEKNVCENSNQENCGEKIYLADIGNS